MAERFFSVKNNPATGFENEQMSGHKLLIVEDFEPVAQVLRASLAEWFEPLHCVASLQAARALCLDGDTPFDLVICSLTLPDGAGEDLRAWLNERTPQRLPFIIIAGGLPGVRRSRTDFIILPKPFSMNDLLQSIDEARTLAASFPGLER